MDIRLPFLIPLLALVALATAQEGGPSVFSAPDELTLQNLAFFEQYAQDHSGAQYAEDAVFHDITVPEPFVGREAIGQMLSSIYVEGFPDAAPEIQSITAVGDRIVLQMLFKGTNTGPLFGNEPTGRAISVPMAVIYDFEDGLIQEAWLYYDGTDYARQLGRIE